jgi:isoleucyl-tRNA synthetase
VLGADFVDTGEGTGVVHIAPGFGEDDQARLRGEHGIPGRAPVDEKGASPPRSRLGRQNVFDANPRSSAT